MGERCTVEGTVQSIIFQNEENGYTVLSLLTDQGEILTVVGCVPCAAPGESLTVTGMWVNHPTYGPQVTAELVERRMPESEEELVSYLSSDSRVTSVQSATIEYDAANDKAVGQLSLILYLIDSPLMEYVQPDVADPGTGKENIFS